MNKEMNQALEAETINTQEALDNMHYEVKTGKSILKPFKNHPEIVSLLETMLYSFLDLDTDPIIDGMIERQKLANCY